MQKQSKNWPGVQYPLKLVNENFEKILKKMKRNMNGRSYHMPFKLQPKCISVFNHSTNLTCNKNNIKRKKKKKEKKKKKRKKVRSIELNDSQLASYKLSLQ